jgi:hypothetical protein
MADGGLHCNKINLIKTQQTYFTAAVSDCLQTRTHKKKYSTTNHTSDNIPSSTQLYSKQSTKPYTITTYRH